MPLRDNRIDRTGSTETHLGRRTGQSLDPRRDARRTHRTLPPDRTAPLRTHRTLRGRQPDRLDDGLVERQSHSELVPVPIDRLEPHPAVDVDGAFVRRIDVEYERLVAGVGGAGDDVSTEFAPDAAVVITRIDEHDELRLPARARRVRRVTDNSSLRRGR